MRILFVVFAAALMSGCPEPAPAPPSPPPAAEPAKVDNAATRYVGGLQNDLDRARKTAATATDAIKAREEEAAKEPGSP